MENSRHVLFAASGAEEYARSAGFEAVDVHMTDIIAGHEDLAGMHGLMACGGFSYGDYLRSGAMAANSPIMREIVSQANAGVPVLGICNGFQILTESGTRA